MKHLLVGLLKLYRLVVSPLYGDVCRYYPSCSAYALRAVGVHGAIKGSWLAARRLLRCHPWAPGGYDPVPGTPEFAEEQREQAARSARMGADQPGGVRPGSGRWEPSDPAADDRPDLSRPGRPTSPRPDPEQHEPDAQMASRRGVN